MRIISATLEAAQQAETIDALHKIVLTHGVTTYTYTREDILRINHSEEPYNQKAEVVLENSDGALDDIDFRGFKGIISSGAIGAAGEEYSARAPLWVTPQTNMWSPVAKHCVISLIGIPNLMAEDKASAKYMPDADDTKAVKTLIDSVLGATMACFSHCTAYDVVWEAGYDTLANTYQPKDDFRIFKGSSRLAALKKLMRYTGNVARVESDGKWHIFKPVTTGAVYDYEYAFLSGHRFFSKAYRLTLVMPNYIIVESREDDDPQYSGYAKDQVSIDALKDVASGETGEKREYIQMRLASNDQAEKIAEATLAMHQLWSEAGAADVPNNVAAEVFDYVKVTDDEANARVGNLGSLTRHYDAEEAEWPMNFSFGSWLTVGKALASIGIMDPDEISNYFSQLMVGDLYVENILAENMDFVWIDPDNTIDLSKIGDTLDNLPDGEVYARIKTLHLDAGQVKLDENVLYALNYDPTAKFDPSLHTLDNVPEGVIYQRAKSAALTAGGLVILDEVVVGTYGLVKSTDISAGHIILSEVEGDLDDISDGGTYEKVRKTDISAGHILLTEDQNLDDQGFKIISNSGSTYIEIRSSRIAGYNNGDKQFELRASDGRAYCGEGAVILDEDGIKVKGDSFLRFYYGSAYDAQIGMIGSNVLQISADAALRLNIGGYTYQFGTSEFDCRDIRCHDIVPDNHEGRSCGYSNKAWRQGYFRDLFSGDGNVYSYQKHDDIALLKAIKGKKKDGRDIIDVKSLPPDLVVENDYVNIAGLAGLNIGIMKALLAKIEALEARYDAAETNS